MSALLDRIDSTRSHRHIKIHEGNVELPYFKDIVFFREFPFDVPEELHNEFTVKKIDEQIASLETELDDIADLTTDFLNELIHHP